MNRLVVEGLSKRFIRRLLFRDLTFTLEGGHSLAVIGANGSGKSTLLRIVAGVMSATKGTVTLEVQGTAVAPMDRPLATGYVAPYFNVYLGMTARENLAFIAKVRRLEGASARVDDVLARIGLKKRADDLVKTYSSGMQQRLKIGVAIMMNPPLLLLDEPTTTLDGPGIAIVRSVMEQQIDRGGLLILATNNPEEVSWCDTSLAIEDFKKKKREAAPLTAGQMQASQN